MKMRTIAAGKVAATTTVAVAELGKRRREKRKKLEGSVGQTVDYSDLLQRHTRWI